jgi:3-oxoacyl-[acyl-carrier protein] reductase
MDRGTELAEAKLWKVEDSQASETYLKEIMDKHGRLDVLVNNAGITKDALSLRMSLEDWHKLMEVNLFGVFSLSRLAARYMLKARSGRIVNISSVVAFTGNPGQANYTAAKAGIIGLTKTLALEYASRGVTVNAVAPGFISTDMTEALSEERKKDFLARIPIGVLGKPEDVAASVAFLISEGASYITGQTIHVNGGLYM